MSLADSIAGEWEMDLAASDALGPLLREIGLNRVLSSLVARLGVKQTISASKDELVINVKTAVSEECLRLPFDGRLVSAPGITGGRSASSSCWLDAGQTRLETRQSIITAQTDDEAIALGAGNSLNDEAFVTVRSLRDGSDVLVESCSIVRAGVTLPQPCADRILRRVKT